MKWIFKKKKAFTLRKKGNCHLFARVIHTFSNRTLNLMHWNPCLRILASFEVECSCVLDRWLLRKSVLPPSLGVIHGPVLILRNVYGPKTSDSTKFSLLSAQSVSRKISFNHKILCEHTEPGGSHSMTTCIQQVAAVPCTLAHCKRWDLLPLFFNPSSIF